MKNFCHKIKTPIFSMILAIIVLLCCFVVYPSLTKRVEREPEGYAGIIRVWQIDSFEGGKGSRASFLNSAARIFEREHEGVLIMVSAHTAESAVQAIESGNVPDMISYGAGIDCVADIALPFEKYSFDYAKNDGKTYAYPWCRGSYFLFTAEGDFSDVTAENTVVSRSGSFSDVAAVCAGLPNGCAAEPSVKAYVNLIDGKYKYMLGTQRDVYRLTTRNISFEAKPISQFNDLWQYLSVCSRDVQVYNICLDFVDCLLSEEVQTKLPQIGMLSPLYNVYDPSDAAMASAEKIVAEKSISAFISARSSAALHEYAKSSLSGDENSLKKLKNYLI